MNVKPKKPEPKPEPVVAPIIDSTSQDSTSNVDINTDSNTNPDTSTNTVTNTEDNTNQNTNDPSSSGDTIVIDIDPNRIKPSGGSGKSAFGHQADSEGEGQDDDNAATIYIIIGLCVGIIIVSIIVYFIRKRGETVTIDQREHKYGNAVNSEERLRPVSDMTISYNEEMDHSFG